MKHSEINEMLISKIKETKQLPWQCPWNNGGQFPFNFLTGHEYTGMNRWMLMLTAPEGDIPAFATCSPKEKRYPKKGSKAYSVIMPRIIHEKDENGKPTKEVKFIFFKKINVFHYTSFSEEIQEKVLEQFKVEPKTEGNALSSLASEFFDTYSTKEVKIQYKGNKAYYSPSKDYINIPPQEAFEDMAEFVATTCHEIAHSTGHTSRLGRFKDNAVPSNEEYSFEELIAEISSVHLCYSLGITPPVDNSVAYLQHWNKQFEDNPSWLLKAFSASEKVIKYIQEKGYLK